MKIFCPVTMTSEQKNHLEKDLNAQIITSLPQDDFYLEFSELALMLKRNNSNEHGVFVDFLADEKKYLQQKISPKNDLLSKAVGVESGLRVCDLTMGLAGDAFKLCYFGASVVGYEKNPQVWALVENAKWRWNSQREPLALTTVNADSTEVLAQQSSVLESYDVFYLDPMFALDRSALPRKEMQYLEQITEPTPDEKLESVFASVKAAKKKLVVKRAVQNDFLLGRKPQRSVEGKMIRFDVYV